MKGKGWQVFFVIVTILFLLSKCGNAIATGDKQYVSDARCYYCGKVIRSAGINIHGTPKYNGGVIECDYCGTDNSIEK